MIILKKRVDRLVKVYRKFEMPMNTINNRKPAAIAVTTFGLLAATLIMTGCSRQVAQQAPPPPAVTVASVEMQQIVEWGEFTGRAEAVESVEVRPRVSGYIQKVQFQSGQLVK